MTPIDSPLQPLTFTSIFKEKIWGGTNLKTVLCKDIPAQCLIGESWEISGYGSDLSYVETKEFANHSLQQLLDSFGPDLVGDIPTTPLFPLLYKFIDAQDRLSVQVHPDDAQAREHGWGNFGKTECWYVIAAKPQADIIVGFKNGVSRDAVRRSIHTNTLDTLLNRVPIAAGDILFIPAGTVHAILDGTVLYEVQETSDTTFRLYDWGRIDTKGVSRKLHIEESLQVLDTAYHEQHKIPPVCVERTATLQHLFRAACRYFALEEYICASPCALVLPQKKSFAVLTVIAGSVSLSVNNTTTTCRTGKTILVPAVCYKTSVQVAVKEETRFLLSTVPDLKTEVIAYLRAMGIPDTAIASLGGNEAHNDIIALL